LDGVADEAIWLRETIQEVGSKGAMEITGAAEKKFGWDAARALSGFLGRGED
jgi:hypothetical protein